MVHLHAYLGLPSSPPDDIVVTPLSSTSFAINWIISNPKYSYIITWTNILNDVVEGKAALPESTNSYNVTGLSDSAIYNVSVTAVGACGMITSNPITVYGEYTMVKIFTSNILCYMVLCIVSLICIL